MEWTGINLSSKLSLTCEGNVNYYKSLDHPIPTLLDRIGNTQAVFKTNQQALLLVECPICSLFGQKEGGRGRPFLEGARRETTL